MFQTKNRFAFYVIALVSSVILASCGGDSIGTKYVSFAKCLTSKNLTMYGAYWCPHCANQKKLFGTEGFKEINYVECDPRGPKADPKLCAKKGVTSYPTWEFPDGTKASGEQSLEELSRRASCPLPSTTAAPATDSTTPPSTTPAK